MGKSAAASISNLNVLNARFNATMHSLSVIDSPFLSPHRCGCSGVVCACARPHWASTDRKTINDTE